MAAPHHGPLYSRGVLRPLAEQLVSRLDFAHDQRAVVIDGDDGVLAGRISEVTGSAPQVVDATSILGGSAAGVLADTLTALCTLRWDMRVADTLPQRARRVALVVWDAADPPEHELALLDALAEEGTDVALRTELLSDIGSLVDAPRWRRETLRDVARFDGVAQLWHALVDERPQVCALLERLERSAAADVRTRFEENVAHRVAPDGSLRIPVHATLLSATTR